MNGSLSTSQKHRWRLSCLDQKTKGFPRNFFGFMWVMITTPLQRGEKPQPRQSWDTKGINRIKQEIIVCCCRHRCAGCDCWSYYSCWWCDCWGECCWCCCRCCSCCFFVGRFEMGLMIKLPAGFWWWGIMVMLKLNMSFIPCIIGFMNATISKVPHSMNETDNKISFYQVLDCPFYNASFHPYFNFFKKRKEEEAS